MGQVRSAGAQGADLKTYGRKTNTEDRRVPSRPCLDFASPRQIGRGRERDRRRKLGWLCFITSVRISFLNRRGRGMQGA